MEKKEKIKSLDPIYQWYELVPTSSNNPSSQQLVSSTPMASPPAQADPSDCARENDSGEYCAVAVEFAPGTTNFALSGTDLQDAINNHPDATGIASSNPDVDENQDGYSRKPAA